MAAINRETWAPELDHSPVDVPVVGADVLRVAGSIYGVDPEAIVGRSRSATVVRARVCAYRMLRRLGWSFPEIGRLVNRDHSSVLQTLKHHDGRVRARSFSAPEITAEALDLTRQNAMEEP